MSEFEEVSLKKVIEVISNEWKIIIGSTAACVLLSIVIAWGIITPIYESEASILMSIPESVETQYGEYHYLASTPQDYFGLYYDQTLLNRTIEKMDLDIQIMEMSSNLSISAEDKSNLVKVKYSTSELDKIDEVLNSHITEFIEEISRSVKRDAFDRFFSSKIVTLSNQLLEKENQLEILTDKHKNVNETLADISPIIILSTETLPMEGEGRHSSQTVSLKNEMKNETYDDMLKIASQYEDEIIGLDLEVKQIKNSLNAMTIMKADYENDPATYISSDQSLDVLTSNIVLLSKPSVPIAPIFPNKLLILVLGAIAGVIIGLSAIILKLNWPNQ